MKKQAVIEILARHADDIRSFGVAHLYLFGSTARDRARRQSDVDLYFDLRRGARFSLFDLIDLRDYLSRLLKSRADAIPRGGLHRVIRRDVQRTAVKVF